MIRIIFFAIVVGIIFAVGYFVGQYKQRKKSSLNSEVLDQILTELPTPITQRQKDLESLLLNFRREMNSES